MDELAHQHCEPTPPDPDPDPDEPESEDGERPEPAKRHKRGGGARSSLVPVTEIARNENARFALLARVVMEDGEQATGWLLDVFEDWDKLPDRYALIVTDADDVASCVAEAEQALGQWYAMVADESPRLARASATWGLALLPLPDNPSNSV